MHFRGKKRGRLAYKGTYNEDDGYLIEEDKRWTLPQTVIPATIPEDEVQEVTIEMTEEKGKPLGITEDKLTIGILKYKNNLLDTCSPSGFS